MPHTAQIQLSEMSRLGKCIGTESRLVVAGGWGMGVTDNERGLAFCSNEIGLKLEVAMGPQL